MDKNTILYIVSALVPALAALLLRQRAVLRRVAAVEMEIGLLRERVTMAEKRLPPPPPGPLSQDWHR